jgi:hypothetical protein
MRHLGRRWKLASGLVLAALALAALVTPMGICQPYPQQQPPVVPTPPQQVQTAPYFQPDQPGQQQIIPAAAQTPAAPLDPALHYLTEAKQAYQNVQDYTCLFVKRELVKGVLQPENVMTMKVRANPFSVYMKWQAPRSLEGQEACYVTGKNNGQMRVHSTGILGIAGWVSLDPNDPRATETSRHTILEAGIGNLIDKYYERWSVENKPGLTTCKIAEYEFAKRRCIRIETTHPNSRPGQFYSYRSVIYLDKELKLPIRSENYDWPRQGGPPGGDLLEVFSYVDLKLNGSLPADAFNY